MTDRIYHTNVNTFWAFQNDRGDPEMAAVAKAAVEILQLKRPDLHKLALADPEHLWLQVHELSGGNYGISVWRDNKEAQRVKFSINGADVRHYFSVHG